MNLKDGLKNAGLSVTKPRLAILNYLKKNHGPFSADEIHKALGLDLCDQATIYRCLSSFEQKGLIKKCFFGDDVVRYEIDDPSHHHHHLICKTCKKVEKVSFCFLKEVDKMLGQKGYIDLEHSLEFFGICPSCQH